MAKQLGTVTKQVVRRAIALSKERQAVAAALPDADAGSRESGGAEAPPQVAAPKGGGGRMRRVRLVVRNGRTVPHAAAQRTSPRPAVRLFLATIDGERVDHWTAPTASRSALSRMQVPQG